MANAGVVIAPVHKPSMRDLNEKIGQIRKLGTTCHNNESNSSRFTLPKRDKSSKPNRKARKRLVLEESGVSSTEAESAGE